MKYSFAAFTTDRFNNKVPCFEGSYDSKKEVAKWWNYFLHADYCIELAVTNNTTGHIDHYIK